jgi:hypothetical protein
MRPDYHPDLMVSLETAGARPWIKPGVDGKTDPGRLPMLVMFIATMSLVKACATASTHPLQAGHRRGHHSNDPSDIRSFET